MKKLKTIWRLIWAKQWVVITRKDEPYYSRIEYSDRYKYPKIAPAHYYAELLIKNNHAVIRWLRNWADILENRTNNPQ